ncbi:hypothetical protein C8Q77DRAFT_1067705 [Trametes polyzona]|nr:hypothetical protein C8Q77DRAFT_1067705 [Trametes polyzona]
MRRIQPDDDSQKLYGSWLALIPSLVPAYLGYMQAVQGRMGQSGFKQTEHSCPSGKCIVKESTILCLYFDFLVQNGLFPASPSAPRMAISIDLLDFYSALFERSADAITALAGALKTMYVRRGFPILNEQGEPIQDPFRRGIGHAVQWYDQLRSRPELMVENALDECLEFIYSANQVCSTTTSPDANKETTKETTRSSLISGSCSRLLQKRCAACFGGVRFGRTYSRHVSCGCTDSELTLRGRDGGDVHVALDATFSQRHNASAGESPWFYEPKYFVPKDEVDAAGVRITAARKKPARSYESQVPEAALDECEKSYDAADEKKEKTHGKKFDDTGLMALVCRHDVVLFLANIDTPGEQQKYAVALLDKLFEHLPDAATVAAFYDIGCVLDRSVQLYGLFPDSIVKRLLFATSVMHAYGHQWACQLVYNPRLREGLGLSEGEGTERVWSKFRKLIGVTRSSARKRRIWLLDRHADAMNRAVREDLGIWIRGRLKNGVEARTLAATQELASLDIGKDELRKQWEAQRTAQLSLRKHAPARLRKELDSVLNLQAELTTVETSLVRLQSSIEAGDEHPIAHEYVASLKRSHARAVQKVEGLYASLNVPQEFPELKGLPLNFVQVLLMARDLKINIRKRAIGSFFEWDKLSRAAGGRDQPLGTKLHQQTQKAITRRTPALTAAIRKFNGYCDQLATMHQAEWNLPLPQPLPTELAILRDDSSLLADVWITPSPTAVPRWLQDSTVRNGIRAMLTLDRCLEERRRLGDEADNLCRWYGRELAAVELALRLPKFSVIAFLLLQKKEELLLLQMRWRTPLVSAHRFQSRTEEAVRIADRLTGAIAAAPIKWVCVPSEDGAPEPGAQTSEGNDADEEVVIAHDTLDELLSLDESDIEDYLLDSVVIVESPSSPRHDFPDVEMIQRTLMFIFPPNDLDRLRQPQAMLSDDCINSGAEALLRYYAIPINRRPAILSTRLMSLHRADADDDSVWRDTSRTKYWERHYWIVPIHRLSPAAHWTLAVVYPHKDPQQIAYFDSFASQSTWEADVKDVYKMVYRLHRIAEEHGHAVADLERDAWVTYPLATRPLQTNAVDCGVWVLACIAALLQGYDGVGLTEQQLSEFRCRMTALVLLMTMRA